MPRFFFDVLDGTTIMDETGVELANVRAARREASHRAAELLRNSPERIWREVDWTVWVRDERGLRLFSMVIFATLAAASPGSDVDGEQIWKDI